MSRSINQIKYIFFAPVSKVHLDGMTFNRDATFPFKVHIVKHLRLHFLTENSLRILE